MNINELTEVDLGHGMRVPPHALDAEKSIIGTALLEAPRVLEVTAVRQVDHESFYDLRHRFIFEAISQLHSDGHAVDAVTVANRLKAAGRFPEAGGYEYIGELIGVSDGAPIEFHAEIVRQKQIARQMIELLSKCQNEAYDSDADGLSGLVDELSRWTTSVSIGSLNSTVEVKDHLGELIQKMQREASGVFDDLVPTGLRDFDKRHGGFNKKELHIIAARPSAGKTALALQIALNAISRDESVGIFSIEMSAQSLLRRMAGSLAGVNLRNIRSLSNQEMSRLTGAMAKLSKAKLVIRDDSEIKAREIQVETRRWVRERGVQIIFIDYLQLIECGSSDDDNRLRLIIGRTCKVLKSLAKELNIPVVVLCQTNRSSVDRKPKLSDLAESGAIEQHADSVSMPWYDHDNESSKREVDRPFLKRMTVTVAKMRNGAIGDFYLDYDMETQRFLNCQFNEADESYQNHP